MEAYLLWICQHIALIMWKKSSNVSCRFANIIFPCVFLYVLFLFLHLYLLFLFYYSNKVCFGYQNLQCLHLLQQQLQSVRNRSKIVSMHPMNVHNHAWKDTHIALSIFSKILVHLINNVLLYTIPVEGNVKIQPQNWIEGMSRKYSYNISNKI